MCVYSYRKGLFNRSTPLAACEYDGTDVSSDALLYLILFDAVVVRIWHVNDVRNVGNSAAVVGSVVLTVEN